MTLLQVHLPRRLMQLASPTSTWNQTFRTENHNEYQDSTEDKVTNTVEGETRKNLRYDMQGISWISLPWYQVEPARTG